MTDKGGVPTQSANRAQSLGFALSGCVYMLRTQKNTRIMALATALVCGLALWLERTALECAILTLAASLVWVTEFINGAIEAAVDLASDAWHPKAKTAKDVAAAATLVAALFAAVTGILVLGEPLAQRFGLAGF